MVAVGALSEDEGHAVFKECTDFSAGGDPDKIMAWWTATLENARQTQQAP